VGPVELREAEERRVWSVSPGDARLVFVDLEMTGLNPRLDRICELCLVACRGQAIERTLESLVNPGVEPGASQEVHGLGAEQLADAPPFAALARGVSELLDGAFLVGHSAEHDVAFLEAELSREGQSLSLAGVVDTLPLSKRSFHAASYRLSDLARQLGIEQPRAHRAGDDARATMHLFWRSVALLEPSSMADLAGVRVGERQPRPELMERVRLAVAAAEQVRVRYRPSRRPPEELLMVLTDLRTDVDPPLVLGYLLPGRGRKELRAERILAVLSGALTSALALPCPRP
jgi:DNA polymerase-3 subunit epsilon